MLTAIESKEWVYGFSIFSFHFLCVCLKCFIKSCEGKQNGLMYDQKERYIDQYVIKPIWLDINS